MKGDLIPGLKFLGGKFLFGKGASPFFFFKENRRDCSLGKNEIISPFLRREEKK